MQARPKILVVEDDLKLREQLVQRLFHGFRPIPANDAEGLFSCLREEHPVDAILLDVLLPGVDGLSVCKKIRSGQEHCPSNIPIIMLSALSVLPTGSQACTPAQMTILPSRFSLQNS